MMTLKEQLVHEQKTAIQFINLYKDTNPQDVSYWQGYLRAVNKLIELRIKK